MSNVEDSNAAPPNAIPLIAPIVGFLLFAISQLKLLAFLIFEVQYHSYLTL